MKQQKFTANSIIVPTIIGDGIGKEIMPHIFRIHEAANSPIKFMPGLLIGQQALDAGEDLIPQAVHDAFKKHKYLFKGPLATPKGKGHKSLNLTLRDLYNLHTNLRPVVSIPGIPSRYQNIDLIVIRENTEDLYKNTEEISEDRETATISFSLSKAAARKALQSAVDIAIAQGRKTITLIHKSNIVKSYSLYTEVMFAEFQPHHPALTFEEYVVDAYCEKVVENPHRFDVIVAPNLFGDIVSDLHLGLIGGIAYGGGGNLGDEFFMFEAIHGSADGTDGVAGKNIANPIGILLSSIMMLRHMGDTNTADRIYAAALYVLQNNTEACTPDRLGNVSKEEKEAHPGNTTTMCDAIIAALNNSELEFNKVAEDSMAEA